ncbi:MAG: amidohydrolase family protein [Planctomycetota bacterium]
MRSHHLPSAAGGALLALTAAAAAQDLGVKAPPQREAIVLTGATLHPVAGPPLADAAIRFVDGTIQWVGAAAEIVSVTTEGDRIIEVAGKHIYPGFISAVTSLGLVEIGSISATRDETEVGDFTPEVRAAVAVNPDSTAMPVTRANGVLAAGAFPRGGALSGHAAVIQLDGWTWEDMTVTDDAGLVLRWPSRRVRWSRMAPDAATRALERVTERREKLDEMFGAARAYLAARAADREVATDLRFDGMRSALEGKRPVFAFADDLESIESVAELAARHQLRMVLVGGREARLCLDLLKRQDIAVVVTGTHRLPRMRHDAYDEPFGLPAALEAAGIRWCLATTGGHSNERNLPYHAATAVAFGLDRDAAVRAITASAATLLGVGDRLGTLEIGKDATLFVVDGDPLEITSVVEQAFIRGRAIDLRSKHTELANKYIEKYRQLGLWPE